jgi:hypothetical protein
VREECSYLVVDGWGLALGLASSRGGTLFVDDAAEMFLLELGGLHPASGGVMLNLVTPDVKTFVYLEHKNCII